MKNEVNRASKAKKTTLRYLLSMIAVVSVLSLSAQTPNYGTPYKGQETQSVSTTAQMPAATMGSVDAGFMQSGSNLPLAAQSGVVTTYDEEQDPSRRNISGPRKDPRPGDWTHPYDDPLGDVMWPLMLLACAYCAFLIIRTRKREAR